MQLDKTAGNGRREVNGVTEMHDAWPVRTVARMTGLSADVIRAWERRYGVVAPRRGPRGSRLYTAGDVTRLRLLARVVAAGRAIGDVAALESVVLERLADSPPVPMAPVPAAPRAIESGSAASGGAQMVIDRALGALVRFDALAIERILSEALLTLGSREFLSLVATPLLRTVGEQWSEGKLSVADEHLLSGIMHNLLSGLVRSRRQAQRAGVLLATPSGEQHEFGLLVAALVISEAGVGVCYLGPDLPADQIIAAARRTGVAAVGVGVMSSANRARAIADVGTLASQLPAGVELWIGGREAHVVSAAVGYPLSIVFEDLEQTEKEARRLSQLRLA